MCGRFNITDSPQLQQLLADLGIDIGPLPERYNIAPTEPVLTVYCEEDGFSAREMRWWLTPSWSDGPSQKYSMFNARAENLEKSRAFTGPFHHKRAVIPASSFIEWQKTGKGKQAWLIEGKDQPLAFAALWDFWSEGSLEVFSCAMITNEATEAFQPIHHRMPVMLAWDEISAWLDHSIDPAELQSFLAPRNLQALSLTPIDNSTNNARNKQAPKACGETIIIA